MEKDFVGRSLKRVERWVERCLEACRLARWSAALAEIECAKAELEAARQEIWGHASGEKRLKSRVADRFQPLVRGLTAAALFLLLAAVPLKVDEGLPRNLVAEEEPSIVFVTQDEKALLLSLRSSLSGNAQRFSGEERVANEVSRQPGREKRMQKEVRNVVCQNAPIDLPRQEKNRAIETGDVMVLVQVGERALRETALPIVND